MSIEFPKEFESIVMKARSEGKRMRVALAGADSESILKGVFEAEADGFVEPILIGNYRKIQDMTEKLRPLRYEIRYLLDNYGARIPEYQPKRDKHRRKQRKKRNRRIPHHALPPKVVRLEEERKEEPQYYRDQRTGCKGQKTQHAPCHEGDECERYHQRENGESARYRLLLCFREFNHGAPIIPYSRFTWKVSARARCPA